MSSGFARRAILLCFTSRVHAQQSLTPPTSHPPVCTETCTYRRRRPRRRPRPPTIPFRVARLPRLWRAPLLLPRRRVVGAVRRRVLRQRRRRRRLGANRRMARGRHRLLRAPTCGVNCASSSSAAVSTWASAPRQRTRGRRRSGASASASSGAARRENYERRMKAHGLEEREGILACDVDQRDAVAAAQHGALGSRAALSREQRRGSCSPPAATRTGGGARDRRVWRAAPRGGNVAGSVTDLVVTGRKLLSAVVRRVAPAAAPPRRSRRPRRRRRPPPLACAHSWAAGHGGLSSLLVRHDGSVSAAANAYFEDRADAEAAPAPSSGGRLC